jgi:hypothetical protein
MTDREAIRRLAVLIGDLAHGIQLMGLCDEARELARSIDDLAEPAAPTVTQEQAERVKSAVAYYFDTKDYGAMGPDWPAFFRAVADALEREGR